MTVDDEIARWDTHANDCGSLHYVPQAQRDAINAAWEAEETT